MKNGKKVLLLLLCAVLIVGATVFGTLAYLTDTEAVTNTFSVGQVHLTLDEAKVNPDGTVVAGAARVQENAYHLLPGHTYSKDPTIHVDGKSEDCYVFVKVDNDIAAYESKDADYTSIAGQIAANGWTALDGVENVYYKTYEKGQDDKDLEVFQEFQIDGMANTVDGWDAITPETTKVKVTGYAVQKAGFGTAKAAWDAADFPEDADAVVVTTTQEFTAALAAGGTVKLGANINFHHDDDSFNALTSDIVLDLNGHTLFVNGPFYAFRKMTIKDSQDNGKFYGHAINGNDITITGGTIYASLADGNGPGNYTITGGTFYGSLGMNSATITGGTFIGYHSNLAGFVPDTHKVSGQPGKYTVTAK